MLRRLTGVAILLITVLTVILSGCGTSSQTPPANQTAPKEYLTPSPQGTPLGQANQNLTKQLSEQKDVLGSSIYEQFGEVYGDIKFNNTVDKAYARTLITELMNKMKASYPGKAITTQAIADGKTFDSVSFKP